MTKKDFIETLKKGNQCGFNIGDVSGVIEANGDAFSITYGIYPGMKEDAVWTDAEDIDTLFNLPVIDGRSLNEQMYRVDRVYLIPVG